MEKIYKFKDLKDDGDALCLFAVIEDRGPRVLVAEVSGQFNTWPIKPTFVYLKSDLVEVKAVN